VNNWANLIILVLLTAELAQGRGISAHRDRNVSFSESMRSLRLQNSNFATPVDFAVPLQKLKLDTLSKWANAIEVSTAFVLMRDFRFISSPNERKFLRRVSWLFPDDGCFARAALAKKNLLEWRFPPIKKLFAFGNLVVKTRNHPSGEVTWWYHVVPVLGVGPDAYVFDPAIEPKRPILISEWVEAIGGISAKVILAICSADTYTPTDSCLNPDAAAESSALDDQLQLLEYERMRLESMHRDPKKELGDSPPWKIALESLGIRTKF
jgi:hypothetical protein